MKNYKVVTAATGNILTSNEVKTHLKVDTTADDNLIAALIVACTNSAQEYTNRFFLETTLDMFADEWKEISTLLKSPVTSVDSIKYYDQDDNQQTLDTSVYAFDMVSMPARIFLKPNQTFPVLSERKNAIEVRYKVGVSSASDVDQAIKQAVLLTIGNYYENRQAVVTGTIATELPMNAKFLLDQYRVQVCR
tara:strand:+ start:870 stop:1445 length:576 start_codon:yes stop_codon:yes gene_type:complete